MLKKVTTPVLTFILFMPLLVIAARAQNQNRKNYSETCRGQIYTPQEVTRRAKLTRPLDLRIAEEARAHDVHGRVVIEAVLCRNGRVTDVRVAESLPYGITESALEEVRSLSFTPAEMNWHTVSQKQRFEFDINPRGIDEKASKEAEGRLIEAVQVIGNRRL